MSSGVALATGLLFFSAAAVSSEPASGPPSIPSVSQDEIAVYDAVLASWLGKAEGRQLVNEQLSPPPSKDEPDFHDCARGLRFSGAEWNVGGPKSLSGVRFKRNAIELIDGSLWKPADPGQAIANGKSVESAVREGFSKSLISFSQIVFSVDRKDALVNFSMVCGSLCGSGATFRLHKSKSGWAVSKRCGGWIS